MAPGGWGLAVIAVLIAFTVIAPIAFSLGVAIGVFAAIDRLGKQPDARSGAGPKLRRALRDQRVGWLS